MYSTSVNLPFIILLCICNFQIFAISEGNWVYSNCRAKQKSWAKRKILNLNTHSHVVFSFPTQQQGTSKLQARKPPPLSLCIHPLQITLKVWKFENSKFSICEVAKLQTSWNLFIFRHFNNTSRPYNFASWFSFPKIVDCFLIIFLKI